MLKRTKKLAGKITKWIIIAYVTDLCRRKVYGEVKKQAKKAIKKKLAKK